MNVSRPEDFHRSYAEAFNSGDVQSVVNLYEPNAVFVPQPDQVVSGHAAIAELPKQFQALGHMLGAMRYFISAGEVALASATWQISGGGPDESRSMFGRRAPSSCAASLTAAGCSSLITRSVRDNGSPMEGYSPETSGGRTVVAGVRRAGSSSEERWPRSLARRIGPLLPAR